MKNVLITGSTGMVGSLVLKECLERDDVGKVTAIVRRKTGIKHPKYIEVFHNDFLNYLKIIKFFKNQDICIYCIGVYTGKVDRDDFRKITVDYTRAFAEILKANSKNITFTFLSGSGADSNEKSSMMFSKDKGIAENILLKSGFDKVYIFRPAYIYPTIPRVEPNFTYKLSRKIYELFGGKFLSAISITSLELAKAMVNISINGSGIKIIENKDIRKYSNSI